MPPLLADHWALDPSVAFLNHGSFGATPKAVLERQSELRRELEAEPVRFMQRRLEPLLDEAAAALAAFIGADAHDVAFVANATTGVNAVLRSLDFDPGDEILVTDHAYNACRNAAEYVAARAGARVVVASIPFPITDHDEALAAVLAAAGDRTRLALIDHVTSPTALVLPIAEIVAALQARGIDVLVDGAHAPGMLELDVTAIGAAYYAGNCHKWMCAPKGAGFLHVRADRQEGIVPTVVSHGANSPRTDRSRFRLLFDWVGTADPTPYLCVPAAIEHMAGLDPEGWPGVRGANRELAIAARDVLADALEVPASAPDDMLGAMAALPLADGPDDVLLDRTLRDPLQDRLLFDHGIEVPVVDWPAPPQRLVRISAQRYNHLDQYRELAAALRQEDARP